MKLYQTLIALGLAGANAAAGVVTFRQGLNGYAGGAETELYSLAASTPQGSNLEVSIDADNGGGVSQGLLGFGAIIGNGPNQIPPDATINSATVSFQITSAGSGLNFHRMLSPWTEAGATWDNFAGGIQADGIEASVAPTLSIGGNNGGSNVLSGPLSVNLTADVQAWANGSPNNGWAILPFIPGGTNGIDFVTKEGAPVLGFPDGGPTLVVDFTPVPEPASLGLVLAGLAFGSRRRK